MSDNNEKDPLAGIQRQQVLIDKGQQEGIAIASRAVQEIVAVARRELLLGDDREIAFGAMLGALLGFVEADSDNGHPIKTQISRQIAAATKHALLTARAGRRRAALQDVSQIIKG